MSIRLRVLEPPGTGLNARVKSKVTRQERRDEEVYEQCCDKTQDHGEDVEPIVAEPAAEGWAIMEAWEQASTTAARSDRSNRLDVGIAGNRWSWRWD